MRAMVDDAAAAAATDVPTPAGLVLAPFRAARFTAAAGAAENLAALTSPPYDVIDDAGVTALEAADPHNVVRLILPKDRSAGEPGSRYARAAETLADWLGSGILARDDAPALYVYEEEQDGHRQRGLVGAVALADPDAGIILPHENTMAGPVSDRLALQQATRANLEPIFLLYEGGGETSRIVAETVATEPLLATVTDDRDPSQIGEGDSGGRVAHRIWALTEPATLVTIAADLLPRRAVIADGHHRYATYRHYQAERHAADDGPGPWDFGLTFLVDATVSGPQVHPIHRAVRGLSVAEAARRAEGAFAVRHLTTAGAAGSADVALLLDELAKAGQAGHAFAITDGRDAYLLTEPSAEVLARSLPADRSAAFRGLDVTVAHLTLISDVWGQEDKVGVVDYFHDAPAAIAAAAGGAGTALLLNPTPVAGVTAVAGAGERMPRKSTLFTPKPRTGLLIRLLDES
ncbi:DUF1015 domain-containing protein [Pseudofrankia sp. BMG5.37]|uniref:DUF1015 domain-containing protein n=1 Tax=Pseudofrankia sp. BMG5.37 TaxID=3050035 RepID=UPI0028961748|nr:DUF1015 domain-containing protein [Pseudofrankia sp. BMG5.37]MDT3445758.1 DUF1015 domain-containing protein [Pseudofrankia sp. BMG5.37]